MMLWIRCLAVCISMFLCLVSGPSHSADVSFVVTPLPLTTAEQKRQGVAGGEGFQKVMSIVYAPSDASRAYLASDTTQVWRSLDGGWTWESCNTGYLANGSSSLFVHPENPLIVYSAANLGKSFKRIGKAPQHQGIYRTLDGGDSWEFIQSAAYFKQEACGSLFAIDSRTLSSSHYTIYTGLFDGSILVSKDSGNTWSKIGVNNGRVLDMLEHPAKPGSFLICTERGLFLLEGTQSTQIGLDLPRPPLSIAGSRKKPNALYAAVGSKGIYVSNDGGMSFERSLSGSLFKAEFSDVEVSPVDPDVAICNLSGRMGSPYYTKDGGRSWSKAESINAKGLTTGKGFFYTSPVAMHPRDPAVALTSSNGRARVLRTEDYGASWFFSGSGYMGGRLQDVLVLGDGDMIFGLTDHGAWRTSDFGKSFTFMNHPSLGGLSIGGVVDNKDALFLSVGGWRDKGLVMSKDMGRSWKRIDKVKGLLRCLHVHEKERKVVYAGLFRSDDNGVRWKRLAHDVITLNPKDNDTVYAVTGKDQKVFVSSDRGESWSPAIKPLGSKVGKLRILAVDPFVPERLLAGTSRGIWVYKAGNWSRLNTSAMKDSFGAEFVSELVFHPEIPGLVFAGKMSPGKGMGNGMWYSCDSGNTWRPVELGSLGTNTSIASINILPGGKVMYVGTAHGIFKVEIKAVK